GPEFRSRHSQGGSQPPLASVPGDLMFSPGFFGYLSSKEQELRPFRICQKLWCFPRTLVPSNKACREGPPYLPPGSTVFTGTQPSVWNGLLSFVAFSSSSVEIHEGEDSEAIHLRKQDQLRNWQAGEQDRSSAIVALAQISNTPFQGKFLFCLPYSHVSPYPVTNMSSI
ncbi:hypothetical protein STEG23_029295, partial [Scotinomys teguina]